MAIPIEDLVSDLTQDEIYDALVALARAAGIPATALARTEPLSQLLDKLSEWFALLWNNTIVKAIRAGFLEYAEGDWLTLLAWVAYGVYRKTATFASIDQLVLENRAGGAYVFAPGDIRVKNAADKTFVNVTGGGLASWTGTGPYPTVKLDFQADEAGSASNTPSGGIQADLVLGPAGVYALPNDDPAFGEDRELDPALRQRCRESTGPLSPGGVEASITALCKSAKRADGSFVDITRVRVVEPGGGEVYVYLAGASGAASGNTASEGTDIYIANQAVQVYAAKIGITVYLEPCIELPYTAAITLVVDRASNLSSTDASTAARAAVEGFVQALPIGGHRLEENGQGYLVASEVAAKASESAEGIISAELVGGNLAVAINEVVVLDPASTYSATVVSQ